MHNEFVIYCASEIKLRNGQYFGCTGAPRMDVSGIDLLPCDQDTITSRTEISPVEDEAQQLLELKGKVLQRRLRSEEAENARRASGEVSEPTKPDPPVIKLAALALVPLDDSILY
jgi:hypothetical protein